MRIQSFAALLGIAAIALTACNTTGSRIRRQQALFDSYPPEVQQNIRNGVIEVGYTPEMVVMAPGFGIGMGTGGYAGGGVGVGTGVTVGEPARSEDHAVVEFSGGRVKRFEALGID
jgi:hypothetical protein